MISPISLYIPCKAALPLVHRLKWNAHFKSEGGRTRYIGTHVPRRAQLAAPASWSQGLWQGPCWPLCNATRPQISSGSSSTIVGLLVHRNCFPATIGLGMKSFPDTRQPRRASSAPHPGLDGSAFLLPVGLQSLVKRQHNKTK